ncbi:MAG TPA: type II toxin-antitoxin system VapC family toxin [Solirubrobacterales bacterium]|nr:type II toxin-antitoxin system VapC family toxin [Solirubrobacterales bacterium]
MVVLDSWALLAYLKDEPAAGRIEAEWLESGAGISSINLGEVLYIRSRAVGENSARADVEKIRRRLTVIDPDWPMVAAAAAIKADGGLSYADAFCVATAVHLGAPLWTGDPEIVDQAAQHSCEVIDLRTDA